MTPLAGAAGKDDTRDPYERLTAEAAAIPPGSDGLLWAPYLMGERTPHLDPNARAALIGLTASHTRGHIVRAILEGVAFSLKDSFTLFAEMGVPVRSIRLGGGGARSALWRQIQADVYGHEVEVLEAEEGAAYGAAILAGVGSRSVEFGRRRLYQAVKVAQPWPRSPRRSSNEGELCCLPPDVSGDCVGLGNGLPGPKLALAVVVSVGRRG